MSGWFNINEGLSSIKGQLTTFANNVLAEDEGADPTLEEYRRLCAQKDLEIQHLQKSIKELQLRKGDNGELNDNTWNWTAPDLPAKAPTPKQPDLEEKLELLEKEKNDLLGQLEQLDAEHQQNLSELMTIREKLQEENEHLKEQNFKLKQQSKDLAPVYSSADSLTKTNQELNDQLEEVIKELTVLKSTHKTLEKTLEISQSGFDEEISKLTHELQEAKTDNTVLQQELSKNKQFIVAAEEKSREDADNCQKLAVILETYEKQVNALKEELALSKTGQDQTSLVQTLQTEIETLTNKLQQQTSEIELIHNKYVNIISQNAKRYIDADESPPEDEHSNAESPQLAQFSHQVENIFKILLEFKQKSYSLEQDLIAASNEKTRILNEKYEEIEKLIQNSEVLSQEVLKKDDTIKELETELRHLISSNDELLAELSTFKNSGLQTISESNEDSMVLLESDLENANKRIKELEEIIDSPSKSSASVCSVPIDGNYQELLSSFDELKIDYEEAVFNLKENSEKLAQLEAENEELRLSNEKNRMDFENVDYQLSEANFALDSLKEEVEKLEQENKDLKLTSMSMIDLKSELNEVREKWMNEENSRRQLEAAMKIITEKQQNSKVSETSLKVQLDSLNKEHTTILEARNNLEQALTNAKSSLQEYESNYTELLQKYDEVLLRCEELNTALHLKEGEVAKLRELEEECHQLRKAVEDYKVQPQLSQEILPESISKEAQGTIEALQNQLQELATSRNELINMVQIKHQESLSYHQEIQRLTAVLDAETKKTLQLEAKLVQAREDVAKRSEEIDKLRDENSFFKDECDVLRNKIAETNGPSEKEQSLSKQLERLQSHLMEMQERYTQEMLQAEQRNQELQAKAVDLEQREKSSSTMYTSVSIRANQQVEALQSQLQAATIQREEARKRASDLEDLNSKQAAALANLQFVLEQFQKDKEKDVHTETERIRRQIDQEKRTQEELKKELDSLRGQLEESKVGLQAASRLSDQMEWLRKTNSGLKEEVSQLQQKLSKSLHTITELSSQTDGKIEKSLIKNLIVGFLSSGATNWNKDQAQVLKLIATVLDFNQQDHEKVRLLGKSQQGSWLGFLLSPQSSSQNMSQESLSQAFVKFLESESRPREVPSLLGEQPTGGPSTETSKRTTPRTTPSPIVLNEVVLPTFADFGQSRSSSSILKDVLKDNLR